MRRHISIAVNAVLLILVSGCSKKAKSSDAEVTSEAAGECSAYVGGWARVGGGSSDRMVSIQQDGSQFPILLDGRPLATAVCANGILNAGGVIGNVGYSQATNRIQLSNMYFQRATSARMAANQDCNDDAVKVTARNLIGGQLRTGLVGFVKNATTITHLEEKNVCRAILPFSDGVDREINYEVSGTTVTVSPLKINAPAPPPALDRCGPKTSVPFTSADREYRRILSSVSTNTTSVGCAYKLVSSRPFDEKAALSIANSFFPRLASANNAVEALSFWYGEPDELALYVYGNFDPGAMKHQLTAELAQSSVPLSIAATAPAPPN